MDILKIPYTTPSILVDSFCSTIKNTPIYNWLMWGRIAENPVITPSMQTQEVMPSAKNRYLNSVKVLKNAVIESTVTLEVGAEASYTFAAAKSLTLTDETVATVTLEDGVVNILGVVAGSTVITVKDSNNDTIATINVTIA